MGNEHNRPWLWLSAAALTIFVVQGLVLDVKQVDGPSMEPTLKNGQIVFSFRLAYGFLLPIIDRYGFLWKSPAKGDIVVVLHPRRDHLIIKRVAAVPGDRLRLEGDKLWIGPRSVPLDANQAYWFRGLEEVPPGKVLVLGDNLTDSQDSRDFGLVPVEDIRGKMVF